MPVVEANGISLYYEDSDPEDKAQLPPVIFLHGAAGNAMSWWQQIPAFSKVHRCIAFDSRGFYRSPDVTGEGVTRFIDDLEALIEHLQLKRRVSLVAQSMGGRAAMAYAVRHPERVSALVMGNTWGSFDWPEHWQLTKDLDAKPLGGIETGQIRGLSAKFQSEKTELTFLFRQISGANRAPKPALSGAQPGGPSIAEVRGLKVPLLCITGTEDVVFPPPLVEGLAEQVPGAECKKFEGAGHSVYYEQPDGFNNLILEFFARHTGQGEVDGSKGAAKVD